MASPLSYFRGGTNVAEEVNGPDEQTGVVDRIRRDLADVLSSKNLAFLLGSGCSSLWDAESECELGIPTMGPMAERFFSGDHAHQVLEAEKEQVATHLGLDLDAPQYRTNLEALMEVLFSYRAVLESTTSESLKGGKTAIETLIAKVSEYIRDTCCHGTFEMDGSVHALYESFYRKIVHRDRALPRPWVFTTNYDLFNETAMDRLGIPYINGFQGSVERRFNPATFRYTLAEQLDLTSRRWSSVDSLIYLAKLHGSVSWESRSDGIFPVVETSPELLTSENLLIYPTPAKQNASFASPYSDMFREFQTRIARDQSVLIAIGYSFSDEHVNNIIFQALTIPTFRLVAFVDPSANETIRELRRLGDPRVWIIGTESPAQSEQGGSALGDAKGHSGSRAHYFSTVVHEFLRAEEDDDASDAVDKVVQRLLNRARRQPGEQ